MTDLDQQVKQLLGETVDERVGPRRTPPRFDPRAEPHHPVGADRWRPSARTVLLSGVAAVCVVAVIVGTVTLSRLTAEPRPIPPTTVTPSPVPTALASPTSSPTAGATPTVPGSSSPPAAGATVHLAGAALVLPRGWVARPMSDYAWLGHYSTPSTWCLAPSSVPVVRATSSRLSNCHLRFGVLAPGPIFGLVDLDTEGGTASDPHDCPPAGVDRSRSVQAQTRKFGGRPAEYRYWRHVCPSGQVVDVAQYVLPNAPSYVLFSASADGTMRAVMGRIASQSRLPVQGNGIRLYDVGILRSIQSASGGKVIRIDRVVPGSSGWVNHGVTTYAYTIAGTRALTDLSNLSIGDVIRIYTDGVRVTDVYRTG